MQKVIVKRSEWLRGEGAVGSMLYRPEDGKRCCIGFACNQLLGLTDEQIAGLKCVGGSPDSKGSLFSAGLIDALPPWARTETAEIGQAYEVNDERAGEESYRPLIRTMPGEATDAARERALQKIGVRLGIDFVFVD